MPSPSIAGCLTKPRNCNSAAEPKKADLPRIPRMTRSFAARLGRFSSNKQHIASCDGRYVAFQMARSPSRGIRLPASCGGSRNYDRQWQPHRREVFDRHEFAQKPRERYVLMPTKSALFGAPRADVTGFGVPELHGDGSALPMLVQSGNLSLNDLVIRVAFSSMKSSGMPFTNPTRSQRRRYMSPETQCCEAREKSLFSGSRQSTTRTESLT